jgi:hypothetical protein
MQSIRLVQFQRRRLFLPEDGGTMFGGDNDFLI